MRFLLGASCSEWTDLVGEADACLATGEPGAFVGEDAFLTGEASFVGEDALVGDAGVAAFAGDPGAFIGEDGLDFAGDPGADLRGEDGRDGDFEPALSGDAGAEVLIGESFGEEALVILKLENTSV